MNKWIASITFSMSLHLVFLIGYDVSSKESIEKVERKITGIKFIEQAKTEIKSDVQKKPGLQKTENKKNPSQKNFILEENKVKKESNESEIENPAREVIDLISQKVILDIQKIWISPNNQDKNLFAEFLLTLDRSGNIKSMKLLRSSGVGAFDRSAQSAIRKYGKIKEISKLDDKTYQKYFSEFTLRFDPK